MSPFLRSAIAVPRSPKSPSKPVAQDVISVRLLTVTNSSRNPAANSGTALIGGNST